MKQITEDIKKNSLRQIYLLYGEERYLRRQYKEKLRAALCAGDDAMNTHFYEGKDVPVGEIIDLAETLPFLAERRVIFITDSGLFKSGGEKLAEYLAADAALRRLTSSLDGLRWKYAAGDRSVGHDIIEGEAEQVRLRKRMQTLRNSAVRMETKTR